MLARRVREHIGQEHRYAHSVRVARCAEILAHAYGASTRRARIAGMLHDIARLYSPDRLISEAAMRGIAIGDIERAHPLLLHAEVGAALAREHFGVSDPEILSAISKHTEGASAMSPLDCAVYLADTLEPGRDFADRAALWELARKDMRAAMRETLREMLAYLSRKGLPMTPRALAAARAFGVER